MNDFERWLAYAAEKLGSSTDASCAGWYVNGTHAERLRGLVLEEQGRRERARGRGAVPLAAAKHESEP